MEPGREQEQPIPIVGPYFLVSFAPSTGIGVYEFRDVTHRFDSVPGRYDRTGKDFDAKGQIEAGIYFNSWDELFAFCKREYFKHKKDTYYGALFTRHLDRTIFSKTLQFLNEPRLCDVNISRIVISLLKEVAEAERVAAVVMQAHELQLKNVETCLATELREIVFSPAAMETLKNASAEADGIAAKLKGYG